MPSFPKRKAVRSERYRRWVRMRPCIICGKGAESAHIGTGGTGLKTDDLRCVSLCHHHHVSSNESIHHLGQPKFEEMFNLDLKEVIIKNLIEFMVDELQFGDLD